MSNLTGNTIDRLVKGAIDFHVHAGPDPLYQRRLDALELALQAKEAGMRAAVIKSHRFGTAPLAYIVNQINPGFSLFGSLVLNSGVGGLNPEVVEVAARMGAKVIWMPTYSSVVDTKRRQENANSFLHTDKAISDEGISLLGKDGKLVPQIAPILEVIKSNNIVLSTGHISIPEIYALTDEARRLKIKVTITHPLTESYGSTLTLKQQAELADNGAFMEHCFLDCVPPYGRLDPKVMAKHIKAVGAAQCILGTDFGQDYNPTPLEGLRLMLASMLKAGLSERELEILVKVNPAKLLDLD